MPVQIQAIDRDEVEHRYDRPEQLAGKQFVRVYVGLGDWSQDEIRQWIRPTLKQYGGELIER